jgi:hypothetical protein
MMSLSTIHRMSQEQAAVAAANKKRPFIVTEEDIRDWKEKYDNGTLRLPFPNIGDYRPDGYLLVDSLFVDKSGFGATDEPALTIEELLNSLKPGRAYAIIEEGQFQLYLGEFMTGVCASVPI